MRLPLPVDASVKLGWVWVSRSSCTLSLLVDTGPSKRRVRSAALEDVASASAAAAAATTAATARVEGDVDGWLHT